MCAARRSPHAGWAWEGGDIWETMARLDADGCARYVVTDITKDGTLAGPNLQLLRDVCTRTDAAVVASGGVPRWTTCAPSPAWALRTGVTWRARLSARPSTPGPSRCLRRWRQSDKRNYAEYAETKKPVSPGQGCTDQSGGKKEKDNTGPREPGA